MKSLAEHMSVYAAHHRHPINRAIHFLCVPAIVWSMMVALDLVALDGAVTLAVPLVGALLLWYLFLDLALGIAAVAVFTGLMVGAITLNQALAGARASLWVAGTVFVVGWTLQFLGHGVWEKRQPALLDNALQALVAPMFLISEAAFALGLRRPLQAEVAERMLAGAA